MKKVKEKSAVKGVSLKGIGIAIASFAFVISALLTTSLFILSNKYRDVTTSTQNYMEWKSVAGDIQLASDYLTNQVRSYVVVGKKKYMDNYFEEAEVSKRRDNALEIFSENVKDTEAYTYIENAINESMDLMNLEYYAMRLVADVKGTDYSAYQKIIDVQISSEDAALDDEGKLRRAVEIVYSDTYNDKKDTISFDITHAVTSLDTLMEKDVLKASDDLRVILAFQQILIGTNVVFLVGIVFILILYFVRPANKAVKALEEDREVEIKGVKEFNFIAVTYNRIRSQNQNVKERLLYEAEHDKLTGLYNRTGYDTIYRRMNLNQIIYSLIDIDNFKEINDKYGHIIGDKVLIRIAKTLDKYFGKDDHAYIFRIGGDEFSLIVEECATLKIDELVAKLKKLSADLAKPEKDIPGVTLSIGIAHGKGADTTDTLFKKADKALYQVKKHGRHDILISE